MAFIDCQMAHDTTKTEQGDVEMSCAHITSFAGHSILIRCVNTVAAWKHRFSSRCLGVVHEQAFGARPASYKAIQDLDKKVRNFYVPPSLRVPGFGGAKMEASGPPPSIELTMQRYTGFAIREISKYSLLYDYSYIHGSTQLFSICTVDSLPRPLKTIQRIL